MQNQESNEGIHSTFEGENISINGNNLGIIEFVQKDKALLSEKGNEYFEKNIHIDSIIFLKKQSKNEFEFLVYERDGTFSEFCGNGVGGAMKHVFQCYGFKKAYFITKSGKKIESSIDDKEVCINVGEGEKCENIEKVIHIENNLIHLFDLLKKFCTSPWLLHKILSDKNKITYFLQILNNLQNDELFGKFVKNIQLKDFVLIWMRASYVT